MDDIEFINLIKQMLMKNPVNRLYRYDLIKNNVWFKNYDWENLENMFLTPIYIPALKKFNCGKTNIPYIEYLKVMLN